MRTRALKYLVAFILPALVALALVGHGWLSFLPLAYAFGLVPLLELLLPTDPKNMEKAELELAKEDRLHDWLLYAMVPAQYALVLLYLFQIQEPGLGPAEWIGRTIALGLACGVIGINVGHELGHRRPRHEQALAQALLLTSLYTHFFIEHNRGHHRRVATLDDPATSRRGEWVQAFWFRSILMGWRSAWRIEADRLRKQGKPTLGWQNQMLRLQILQLAWIALLMALFPWQAVAGFAAAALFGALLLETVNYIEHYGLQRDKEPDGRPGKVTALHSWNSDHVLGRLILFELSRHSDHHYRADRKYQTLRHHPESPQMPTGYPGMMLLALLPPLWFRVMHPAIDQLRAGAQSREA